MQAGRVSNLQQLVLKSSTQLRQYDWPVAALRQLQPVARAGNFGFAAKAVVAYWGKQTFNPLLNML
jgi:hypothetical protein